MVEVYPQVVEAYSTLDFTGPQIKIHLLNYIESRIDNNGAKYNGANEKTA